MLYQHHEYTRTCERATSDGRASSALEPAFRDTEQGRSEYRDFVVSISFIFTDPPEDRYIVYIHRYHIAVPSPQVHKSMGTRDKQWQGVSFLMAW